MPDTDQLVNLCYKKLGSMEKDIANVAADVENLKKLINLLISKHVPDIKDHVDIVVSDHTERVIRHMVEG